MSALWRPGKVLNSALFRTGTSVASATTGEESLVPTGASLPVDVIVHVLLFLEGDTATLCSCACVATAWRDAVSTPAVWRTLSFNGHQRREAAKWRGKTLALLVRRAGAALEVLDISHAGRLRNADLACLSLPAAPSLRVVRACGDGLPFPERDMQLTPKGLIAALSGRKLERLEVMGLIIDEDVAYEAYDATMDALSQLVVEDGLDTNQVCKSEMHCGCLIDEDSSFECGACGAVWCDWCATGHEGEEWGESLCSNCARNPDRALDELIFRDPPPDYYEL